MSEFLKWFEAQHGSRERLFLDKSDAALREMQAQGYVAEKELQRRQDWDSRHESALYAWQAKERV